MAVCAKLTILLGIIGYLATTGHCYQPQNEDNSISTKELCERFLLNTTIHRAITAARNQSSACPCTQNVMETDVTFQLQQGCYVQMFYENGIKQKCCYDNYGNLVAGAPSGGYIVLEQFEQNIELAKHTCCKDSQTCKDFYQFNPSNDCSTFKASNPAMSWGDPEITTIDHHIFSFNGHGEYIFLLLNDSKGEMEIQARTDYLEKGNVDATIFVAFVIHAHIHSPNKSDLLHVHLDKTNSTVAVYPNNGTRLQVTTKPLKSSLFQIIYTNSSYVLIQSAAQAVRVQISYIKDLGLLISVGNARNGSGLAGSTRDNKFVARNGTCYSVNASEAEIFDYGESWSLKDQNQSKFHYNITGGNFTFYNGNHSRPRFLELLTNNLTELFKGWKEANITLLNTTCYMIWNNSVSKDCLLAIARSKKLETGRAVIEQLRQQHDLRRRLENKPPTFKTDMVRHVFVNFSDTEPLTIDLSQYVEDMNNDTLVYEVETNIRPSTYTIDNTTGLFTWKVGAQARWEDVTLTFLVKDEFSTTPFSLSISYCGCEKEEQCDFTFLEPSNSTSKDKFERYGCTCTGLYTFGRFCENRRDPCGNISCTSGELNLGCDNSSDADNPCDPCPRGYLTNFTETPVRQQTCENINECEVDNPCEHYCNDTEGAYNCSCKKGFALDSTDNRTCLDVDECKEDTKLCEVNEFCQNLLGNYSCVCTAGYRWNSITGKCEKIDGFLYTFTMAFIVSNPDRSKPPSKEDVKQELWNALNTSTNFTDLIINKVYYGNPSNSSRKRRETVTTMLHIDYTVILESNTTYEVLKKNLTKAINTCSLQLENITLFIGSNFIIETPPGGSCSVGYDCDEATSSCLDNNGTLSCPCKDGFAEAKKGSKYCRDADECLDKKIIERCVGGKCINKYNGWNCTCPSNTTWAKVGDDHYPYSYRCQGNHSYIGNISIVRKDDKKWNSSELTDYLQDLFKLWFDNETMTQGQTSLLKDLYMKTTIFHFIVTQQEFLGEPFGYRYNCSFILTLGDAVNMSRLKDVCETGKNNSIKPQICTDDFYDCRILQFDLYNDTDDKLCDLGNKCDKISTTCSVSSGVYRCECKEGFYRFDDFNCRDIDECVMDISRNSCISTGGNCKNSNGNWSCTCQDGYKDKMYSFEDRTCENIDECTKFQPCQENSTCHDTEGSWNCTCNEGYYETGMNTTRRECVDIDECKDGHYCNGTCNNTDGSFNCECPDGFNATTFDNRSIACIDIDECLLNETYSCNNGTCKNQNGSWGCQCDIVLIKAKENETVITCQDIDECKDGHYCNGTCNNTDGSFNCVCPDGFNATTFDNRSIACIGNNTTAAPEEKNTTTMPGENHNTAAPGENYTTAAPEGKHTTAAPEEKSLKTILIASAGSFGGVVLILVITIVIICRKRKKEEKEKPNKEENISLSTVGNNFSYGIRTWDNQQTSNVDRASRSSSFMSNGLSPGFIPRVSLLAGSEPRPDYGSPPVSQKPAFQRPASMNMDYGRHGSPNYDFHGQQYPRTSYGSYDSVMDAGRGNMNMDYFGHKKPVTNPLYSEVRRKT